MSEKLINSVISALIGGVVGAAVVFFLAGNKNQFDSLEVGDLTIKNKAVVLDKDGKDDVILRDGSVLANNVILGKKFIGTQYQGHVFVANHMFTSPDNLNAKPMEEWRFFTEIRSTDQMGGEFIVRSPNGANVVGQPVNKGRMLRTGFDQNENPMMFAVDNAQGGIARVPFVVPPQQQQASIEQKTADMVGNGAPVDAKTAEAAPVEGKSAR